MYRACRLICPQLGAPLRPTSLHSRLLSSLSRLQVCSSNQHKESPATQDVSCHSQKTAASSPWQPQFWAHRSTWKRAGINTLRCLVGCTAGDFSTMWLLQTVYPELGMGAIMAASMASGITTSIILETTLLRLGADRLSWPTAARTAMGMSMVSMLAMEVAENVVDYHLTAGVVDFGDLQFWLAAVVSMGAGYLAPLPYNYLRLRKYGKACH